MVGRFLVSLALITSLGACDFIGPGSETGPRRRPLAEPSNENSHVIGLVGTMSGDDAWRGEDALEGADVAVGRLNRGLAPGDPHFELISLDDEGDATRATDLVEQVAALEQAVGVIYAGPPEGLPPAEDALDAAGIPALLVYGDLYSARRLTPHVFQIPAPYLWAARRSASYLLRDRAYETIGVLAEDSPGGDTAVRAVKEALPLYGGKRPSVATYDPGSEELGPALDDLARAKAEALVFHGDPGAFADVVSELEGRGSAYRGTAAARIASLDQKERRRLKKKDVQRPWRPQLVGLDLAFAPSETSPSPGTVVAETYGRGVHYLPVPSLRRFRKAFLAWWDSEPLGWEQRSYTGVRALGWAVERSEEDKDLAKALERLDGRRFGGLDVTLGPDDHTFAGVTTVGLWVVPRPDLEIRGAEGLPDTLPWVPLSRGFSIDGETTDILPSDWKHLFGNAPPPGGPAPKVTSLRYGVHTRANDPIH